MEQTQDPKYSITKRAAVEYEKLSEGFMRELVENPETSAERFRAYAHTMYHELFHSRASLTAQQKKDLSDQMAKLGGMDKKTETQVQGGGFSIQINIPAINGQSEKVVMAHRVEDEAPIEVTLPGKLPKPNVFEGLGE